MRLSLSFHYANAEQAHSRWSRLGLAGFLLLPAQAWSQGRVDRRIPIAPDASIRDGIVAQPGLREYLPDPALRPRARDGQTGQRMTTMVPDIIAVYTGPQEPPAQAGR